MDEQTLHRWAMEGAKKRRSDLLAELADLDRTFPGLKRDMNRERLQANAALARAARQRKIAERGVRVGRPRGSKNSKTTE